ncbi:MAG: DALR domain-containing protein, partial [Alphaproteobacteria bacterium]
RGHYRQPLDWTAEGLEQSRKTLDRLYGVLRDLKDVPGLADPRTAPVPDAFWAALADDLNTPRALAELHELARHARQCLNDGEDAAILRQAKADLLAAGALLGLLQADPETWFHQAGAVGIDPVEIEALVAAREEARRIRDFAEADRIRDALAEKGIVLEDGPGGTVWRVAGQTL